MSSTGTIKIFDKGGEILQIKLYHSRVNRQQHIDYWRLIYGVKFENCFLQITPKDVHPDYIKKDGTNRNAKKDQSVAAKDYNMPQQSAPVVSLANC